MGCETLIQLSIFYIGITESLFELLKGEFLTGGLMAAELLHYTLLHFGLNLESQDIFIDLMLKFDLCYQVDHATSAPGVMGSQRILQFPWFLTSSPPDDFEKKWPEKVIPY